MSINIWLSALKRRLRSQKPSRRRRVNPLSGLNDWLLEDRCLLSSGLPLPIDTSGITSIGQVMYNGVTGTDQKSITITNNSDQTIYAFLEGENSLTSLTQPQYAATAVYDPYDPANHEYRGYVGYVENGTDYAGLPAHSSITITNVPMAFWDSGRIIFSTDGDDQFNTTNNTFNYAATNGQAQYYLNTNGSNSTNQLYFSPVYNGFGADGLPSDTNWVDSGSSPVDTTGKNQPGTLQPGTYSINGPGIPANTTATISAANPTYVTLSNTVNGLSGQNNQYTFNAAGQSTTTSDTLHYIQTGYTLTNVNDNTSTSTGDVMWYHSLGALNPTNETPYQLAESTFRSTLYGTTGYQALMTQSQYLDAKLTAADYDISYVDAANMPIAMEAPNVPVTVNVNGQPTVIQAPFGWAGSDKSLQDFENALQAFNSANSNGNNSNGLGWYFGGQGYPAYPTVQSGNIKLPSGYNLFNGPTPLPGSTYASQDIEKIWYSWAKYYVDNIGQLNPQPPTQAVTGTISNGNVLTLDNPSLAGGLLPGMMVTSPQNSNLKVFILYIGQNGEIHLSETVSGITQFQFSNPDLNSILGYSNASQLGLYTFQFDPQDQATALAFAQTVYTVMAGWSHTPDLNPANPTPPDRLLLSQIIGGNFGPHYPNGNPDITATLTDMSKSALRGVPDFTSPLYSDPAQWYPDPALPTPGLVSGINPAQPFNVYNLNPYVWFIHEKLGSGAYAFALDDDVGNVNAGGATELDVSIGGVTGLTNQTPFTNVSPWGVLTSTNTTPGTYPNQNATQNTSFIASTPGTYPNGVPPLATIAAQIQQFNYNANTPGALIVGPGVPMGTTVQNTNINPDPTQTTITLTNPLQSNTATNTKFSFFGPLTFTGTVLGNGQPTNTIYLDNADAYNTLSDLVRLDDIRVTGEGIDPTKTVTFSLSQFNGQYVVNLLNPDNTPYNLDPNLVSQKGGSYAFTFGSPVTSLVHNAGFEFNLDVPKVNGQYLPGNVLSPTGTTPNEWVYHDAVDANPSNPLDPNNRYAGIAFAPGGANDNSYYTNNNPAAPQGIDVGFIQGQSYIISAQPSLVTLVPGKYTLSFSVAQSAKYISAGQMQTLNVQLVPGGDLTKKPVSLGTTPSSSNASWQNANFTFTVGFGSGATVTPGQYALMLQGTTTDASTALIDNIVLTPPSSSQVSPSPIGGTPPPISTPPPTRSPVSSSSPVTLADLVRLAEDEVLLTLSQVFALVDRALGIVPDATLESSLAAYQNAIDANPAEQTSLGQEVAQFTQWETIYTIWKLLESTPG